MLLSISYLIVGDKFIHDLVADTKTASKVNVRAVNYAISAVGQCFSHMFIAYGEVVTARLTSMVCLPSDGGRAVSARALR